MNSNTPNPNAALPAAGAMIVDDSAVARAVTAAGDRPPALDPAMLAALREAIGELTPVFAAARDNLPPHLTALTAAVAAGAADTICREAHSLAGACGNLGATEAMRLARLLEDAGRTGDLAAAPTLSAALTAEFDRVLAAMTAEIAREGRG